MNKEQAKEKIKKLVEKYRNFSLSQKKECNESMVCKDFVLPLFQALGWDVYNNFGHEVASEAQISGKRADYAFYVNDVIKFFVEAKKPSIDLREEKLAEQAVFYAWHKSVPWAVLTNFGVIKVFNAEWDEPDVERSLIFEINSEDFLQDKKLWWLSKESMEKGELDKYAQENFKKPKREPVDKQLANDLVRWRTNLFSDLSQWNRDKNFGEKNIAKAVQQLLDRFIFIRTTEDRKIEGEKLRELVRNWEENKKEIKLGDELKELFQYYNDGYDSRLFEVSACDQLVYEDSLFADIIKQLYKNKKGIRYDFASINADVLGSIYEQYLGQIQESEKNKSKRKSQGIYYTPRYIVDYIVRNTLGELIKDRSGHEAAKLKILDPACGSGSFLIKAFEVLDNHIKRENNQLNAQKFTNYARKMAILTANIYGVDLDEEAVEIAQLNLLLKVLEQREKLPNLGHNIENGNSLISGTPKELEKYFGKDWKAKKPFDWQGKFHDAFRQGGFDVIIGNPPYVSFYSRESHLDSYAEDLQWLIDNYGLTQKYEDRRLNTVMFFIEKAISLLSPNGILGFIIDANFLEKPFRAVRKLIIADKLEVTISKKMSVFFGVGSDQVILFLKKGGNKLSKAVNIIELDIEKQIFLDTKAKISAIEFGKDTVNLNTDRIELDCGETLSNFGDLTTGVQIGIGGTRKYNGKEIETLFYSDEKMPNYYQNISLKSKDFYRYSHVKEKNYINLNEDLAYRINREVEKCNIAVTKAVDFKDVPKIFIRQSSNQIIATLGNPGQISEYSAFMFKTTNVTDLKWILAVLNSRLITFYCLQENIILTGSKKQPQIRLKGLNIIPIPKLDKRNKNELSILAEKILQSNQELDKIDPILDKEEYEENKKEIEKIDKEIDQRVYRLYGLTAEEIKIVEGEK